MRIGEAVRGLHPKSKAIVLNAIRQSGFTKEDLRELNWTFSSHLWNVGNFSLPGRQNRIAFFWCDCEIQFINWRDRNPERRPLLPRSDDVFDPFLLHDDHDDAARARAEDAAPVDHHEHDPQPDGEDDDDEEGSEGQERRGDRREARQAQEEGQGQEQEQEQRDQARQRYVWRPGRQAGGAFIPFRSKFSARMTSLKVFGCSLFWH